MQDIFMYSRDFDFHGIPDVLCDSFDMGSYQRTIKYRPLFVDSSPHSKLEKLPKAFIEKLRRVERAENLRIMQDINSIIFDDKEV